MEFSIGAWLEIGSLATRTPEAWTPKLEIVPISLNDKYLKVRCGDYYMDIGLLEDGEEFRILTEYPVEKELPRLSQTEISKILNLCLKN